MTQAVVETLTQYDHTRCGRPMGQIYADMTSYLDCSVAVGLLNEHRLINVWLQIKDEALYVNIKALMIAKALMKIKFVIKKSPEWQCECSKGNWMKQPYQETADSIKHLSPTVGCAELHVLYTQTCDTWKYEYIWWHVYNICSVCSRRDSQILKYCTCLCASFILYRVVKQLFVINHIQNNNNKIRIKK